MHGSKQSAIVIATVFVLVLLILIPILVVALAPQAVFQITKQPVPDLTARLREGQGASFVTQQAIITVKSGQGTFTLTANPTSPQMLDTSPVGTLITTVTVSSTTTQTINLIGEVTGLMVNLSPSYGIAAPQFTSSLTLASTPHIGTYTITITGVAATERQSITIPVTVRSSVTTTTTQGSSPTTLGAPMDFTFSLTSSSPTIKPGESGGFTMALTRTSGSPEPVYVTATNLQTGIGITISPPSCDMQNPCTISILIQVDSSVPPNPYAFKLHATSQHTAKTFTAVVTVPENIIEQVWVPPFYVSFSNISPATANWLINQLGDIIGYLNGKMYAPSGASYTLIFVGVPGNFISAGYAGTVAKISWPTNMDMAIGDVLKGYLLHELVHVYQFMTVGSNELWWVEGVATAIQDIYMHSEHFDPIWYRQLGVGEDRALVEEIFTGPVIRNLDQPMDIDQHKFESQWLLLYDLNPNIFKETAQLQMQGKTMRQALASIFSGTTIEGRNITQWMDAVGFLDQNDPRRGQPVVGFYYDYTNAAPTRMRFKIFILQETRVSEGWAVSFVPFTITWNIKDATTAAPIASQFTINGVSDVSTYYYVPDLSVPKNTPILALQFTVTTNTGTTITRATTIFQFNTYQREYGFALVDPTTGLIKQTSLTVSFNGREYSSTTGSAYFITSENILERAVTISFRSGLGDTIITNTRLSPYFSTYITATTP